MSRVGRRRIHRGIVLSSNPALRYSKRRGWAAFVDPSMAACRILGSSRRWLLSGSWRIPSVFVYSLPLMWRVGCGRQFGSVCEDRILNVGETSQRQADANRGEFGRI